MSFSVRIHPDCTRQRHDVGGRMFERNVWYHDVPDAVATKLKLVTDSPHNPNSLKIFQVETKERALAISLTEAKQKQSPAQIQVDAAREQELGELRAKTARQDAILEILAHSLGIDLSALASAPAAPAEPEAKPEPPKAKDEPRRPGKVPPKSETATSPADKS